MLRKLFGFAEQQKNATFCLLFALTMERNNDIDVTKRHNIFANATVVITSIDWYVPHYTSEATSQTIWAYFE